MPFATYMLDNMLRFNFLHKAIDWYIGLKNEWKVNTGVRGKKYKYYLEDSIWQKYTQTFANSNIEENWMAFFETIELFSLLANNIGKRLGYGYPTEIENKVKGFCSYIKNKKDE